MAGESPATGHRALRQRIRGDAGSLADLDVLAAQIQDRHGRLDVLFANRPAASRDPGQFCEPGYIETPMFDAANAVAVLASREAAYINGQDLVIDDGLVAAIR
jgi:NAD(P)-dependent dehydrogenase (short-subunit alcohol dehydrogenase family)